MRKQLTKFVKDHLLGRRVAILFVLTNAIYVCMLTITIPQVMEFADGMKLLDMMPLGYDGQYVDHLLSSLGAAGRSTYLFHQIPLDMIYPLLFGLTYCLLLAYVLQKLDKLMCPFLYGCLLPILAGMADYLENMGSYHPAHTVS